MNQVPPEMLEVPGRVLTERLADHADILDPDLALWRVVYIPVWPFTGSPTVGTWPQGWLGVDNKSQLWVCTVGGTPGTWAQVGGGAGGFYASLTGPGETNPTGSLTQTGGFTVNDNTATGVQLLTNGGGVIIEDTLGGGMQLIASPGSLKFNPAAGTTLTDASASGLTITESGSGGITLNNTDGSGSGITVNDMTANGTSITSNGPVSIASSSGEITLSPPPPATVVSTVFTANAYTLHLADQGTAQQANNGATAATITVPTNASVAFPLGCVITFTQTGAGKIQLAVAGGVTIVSSVPGGFAAGATGCRAEWSTIGLLKTATNTWVLSGDVA